MRRLYCCLFVLSALSIDSVGSAQAQGEKIPPPEVIGARNDPSLEAKTPPTSDEKKGEKREPEPVPTKADVDAAAKAGTDAASAASQRADQAWMLTASAFVMLMLPGLALFYGGMVRKKNVLGTMMHSMVALSIVGIQWILIGYSLAFGPPAVFSEKEEDGEKVKHSYIGYSSDYVLLNNSEAPKNYPGLTIPTYLHCIFQGMFAIITPALIAGAFAERVRFLPYCLFILLWTTLVYDPLAHWVWNADGWLLKMGAIDFAGGTVVHIAGGFSGLAAILIIRKRVGYPQHPMHPNSMVLTLLGAGLLWFGWFGFNAGSAAAANQQAVSAFVVTQVAAAAAGLSWILVESCHRGKPTALGLASGIVAGLVAITPASGFVGPSAALLIGLIAGIVCYAAVFAKTILGYDDSLDAFGVHGVGGFLGAVLTGACLSVFVWQTGYNGASFIEEKIKKEVDGKKTEVLASTSVIGLKGKIDKEDVELVYKTTYKEDGTVEKAGYETIDGKPAEAKNLQSPSVAFDEGGYPALITVQLIAATVAAMYSFLVTAVLVLLLEFTIGFTIKPEVEVSQGVDLAEHGEVGFDYGGGLEGLSTLTVDPKSAQSPASKSGPSSRRFFVVVDGPDSKELLQAWSRLCQVGSEPPSPLFKAVYANVTTVSGNRFRFRGGDPGVMRETLQKLFQTVLNGTPVRTWVEG